jgi:hypothetical protein
MGRGWGPIRVEKERREGGGSEPSAGQKGKGEENEPVSLFPFSISFSFSQIPYTLCLNAFEIHIWMWKHEKCTTICSQAGKQANKPKHTCGSYILCVTIIYFLS